MTNYSSLLQWNYPTPVTPPEAIFGYILLMVVLVFPWIKFALYKATSYTSSIDEYTPLCQFIHNYRLPFGEIYENYPLSIFTKCSHLSSFNFVVIFYNYTKGRFPNWLDRLATDKTDNRNEDMFVWCYESISLHAGDLWHILHVINLWVKISM